MMEKIAWYQEVLEQEPGSRVFFPLARLLLDDNRPDEAVAVLLNGLSKHPDFLEARLFLIQLLSDCNHVDLCRAEVAKVSGLLESYPAFWDAWAQSAATKEQELAMRLLAVLFRYPVATLSDVLERGLDSLAEKKESPVDMEDCPILVDTAQLPIPDQEFNEEPIPELEPHPVLEDLPPLELSDLDLPPLESSDLDMPEQELPPLDMPEQVVPAQKSRSKSVQNLMKKNDFDDDLHEEIGEPTLRTRSMAEVLADQGDVAGALEIYLELESAAPTPAEARILHDRVLALAASIGEKIPAGEPAEIPAPDTLEAPARIEAPVIPEAPASIETPVPLEAPVRVETQVPVEAPVRAETQVPLEAPVSVEAPVEPEPHTSVPQDMKSLLESLASRLEARARV